MGLEISKCYSSYSFHPMSIKLHEAIGYHGGIQTVTFLGNRLIFKLLWHFEILTWQSLQWENPKMCNILKIVDRRVKLMKLWDLRSQELHMQGTFRVRSFEFSLGLFGALCKISDVKIIKRLLLPQFSSRLFFSLYLPNCQSICHFQDKLATLPVYINLCWFHQAKGQADRQGLCCTNKTRRPLGEQKTPPTHKFSWVRIELQPGICTCI